MRKTATCNVLLPCTPWEPWQLGGSQIFSTFTVLLKPRVLWLWVSRRQRIASKISRAHKAIRTVKKLDQNNRAERLSKILTRCGSSRSNCLRATVDANSFLSILACREFLTYITHVSCLTVYTREKAIKTIVIHIRYGGAKRCDLNLLSLTGFPHSSIGSSSLSLGL